MYPHCFGIDVCLKCLGYASLNDWCCLESVVMVISYEVTHNKKLVVFPSLLSHKKQNTYRNINITTDNIIFKLHKFVIFTSSLGLVRYFCHSWQSEAET